MKYKIKSKVWLWNPEKGTWHFVTVEPYTAQKISKNYKEFKRGWGSLPVIATFKNPENSKKKIILETCVFPNKGATPELFTYIMPVKKKTRVELGIQDGDIVEFTLEIKGIKPMFTRPRS